jgi:hypothetical protein
MLPKVHWPCCVMVPRLSTTCELCLCDILLRYATGSAPQSHLSAKMEFENHAQIEVVLSCLLSPLPQEDVNNEILMNDNNEYR